MSVTAVLLLAGTGVTVGAACIGTEETNAAVNRLEYIEMCFAVPSLLGCLAATAVIFGHNRDRRSLRDRILLGMFASNVICSIGFLIPSNMVHTSGPKCGLSVASARTIASGLGFMFGGKYMMVSHELFVVFAQTRSAPGARRSRGASRSPPTASA